MPPTKVDTDKLRHCGAALKYLRLEHLHGTSNRLNNRANKSHVPISRYKRIEDLPGSYSHYFL